MNSFTTKYIPDEGNPVIGFDLVDDQLEFHINDTPWNADSVQSYDLTKDETEQLRQLLGCPGVDNEKVDDVYLYHVYAEYKTPYGGTWTIDDILPLNEEVTDYLSLKQVICDDQGLDCDPTELIIKSLTRL